MIAHSHFDFYQNRIAFWFQTSSFSFEWDFSKPNISFTGTGCEVWGNINAPKAVTHSALIYSLRCLVNEDIPLNQGCLNPVQIIIPEKSILDPSEDAAVVGGNVLTSQRVVDVILRAFGACAARYDFTLKVTNNNFWSQA